MYGYEYIHPSMFCQGGIQAVEKYFHRVARIYSRISARCTRDARITNTLHPERMIDTRYRGFILAKVE